MIEKILSYKAFYPIYWGVTAASLILSRWFLKANYLYHWDSVQFALSLKDFDILHHQPHPPGYIIYVYLSKAVNYFVNDPNIALITVGVLFSLLGLVLIVNLATQIFNRQVGYLAGILFLVNPAIWFHGLVAEVYIVEAVWVLLVLLLAYKYQSKRSQNNLIWLGVALGLLGGIRQVAEILLLPLVIYLVFFNKKYKPKELKIFLWSWIGSNLIWFVPIIYFTGFSSYFYALSTITQATVWNLYTTKGVNLLIDNFSLLWQILKISLSIQIPILIMALLPYIAGESRNKYKVKKPKVWFFALAIIPGVILLPLMIVRNPGYVLYLIPIFIILSAAAIKFLGQVTANWNLRFGQVVYATFFVGVVFAGVVGFYITKPLDFKYTSTSLASVKAIDSEIGQLVSSVNSNFNSEADIIFVNQDLVFRGLRHFQYYLPEFDVYSYSPSAIIHDPDKIIWHVKGPSIFEFKNSIAIDLNKTEKIIIFSEELNSASNQYLSEENLGDNHPIKYFDLQNKETLDYLKQDIRFVFNE